LRSWGDNTHYQLGNADISSNDTPMPIAPGQFFQTISAGGFEGAAIDVDLGLFA
jgi:hypothetical protein